MTTQHNISIASVEAVRKRVEQLKRRDEATRARVAPFLKKLWKPERAQAMGAPNAVFDDLAIRFPNFISVIDYWRVSAAVSRKLDVPFLPQPVLLAGPPGLGKTLFSSQAAKAMELYFSEISMATITAAFVISGGSLQWTDGSPGFIAKTLCDSEIGNPMVLIDEVDKAMDGNYNPMGPFYSLLEKHSAQRFRDEALEMELDASNIIWVATANDIRTIPQPILSRMKYFDIRSPDPSEMHQIVNSIYRSIRDNEPVGKLMDEQLPEDTTKMLAHLLPREARKALQDACMQAFTDNRSKVLPKDVMVEMGPRKGRLGFI